MYALMNCGEVVFGGAEVDGLRAESYDEGNTIGLVLGWGMAISHGFYVARPVKAALSE